MKYFIATLALVASVCTWSVVVALLVDSPTISFILSMPAGALGVSVMMLVLSSYD